MLESLLSEIIVVMIVAVWSSVITTFVNKKLRLKQQLRLWKNLNRPIAFIKNDALFKNDEINLLQESWIFKEIDVFGLAKNFRWNKSYWLIIYTYNKKNLDYLEDVISIAKNHNTPIIFYSNWHFLEEAEKKSITSILEYPRCHLTQWTLNLLSAVFTTLSTYNHGK